MKKQIIKNIASNYLVSLFGIVLGFMLVPFLIRKLGRDSYGLIALVDSTVIFFEVATVSVRTALARYATFSLSEGNEAEFKDNLNTGYAVLYISAAVVFIIGVLISVFFPVIFKVPDHLKLQSQLLFFFTVLAFTMSIPNIVYWSVLYARQRFDLINFGMSFGTLTRAGALFGLFSVLPASKVTLITYGLIYLLFTWVQNHMIYRFHKKVIPDLRLDARLYKKDKAKAILSFSVYSSLHRLSGLLVANMTNILLNLFYGPSANAFYSVATKLPMMMRRLFTEATWSLTPTFTDLAAKKDQVRLEKLYFLYTKLLVVVTSPICLLMIVFGRQIIMHWVGRDFLVSGELVALYTAPLVLGIPFAVCGCINNAFGKVKVPSQAGIIYSVSNILFGVLLARGFGMGIYGFAISNICTAFLFLMLFQPYYACRVANISLARYLTESFFKPMVPVCLLIGGAWFVFRATFSNIDLPVFSVIRISAMLVIGSYLVNFFFALRADERRFAVEFIQKLKSRSSR